MSFRNAPPVSRLFETDRNGQAMSKGAIWQLFQSWSLSRLRKAIPYLSPEAGGFCPA